MREHRIDASLGPWGVEDKLGLSVLLQDGVVVANRYRAISVPIRGYPYAKNGVVQAKRQSNHPQYGEHGAKGNPP
jgi:hypothetical protein